eukprot:COSAG01_NODE_1379_length_10522_cov_25.951454_16_plen_31_part_00
MMRVGADARVHGAAAGAAAAAALERAGLLI